MAQIGLFPSGLSEGSIIGGKYRLLRKLSEGGSGTVWEATSSSGEKLALKLLKWSPLASKEDSTERFKNEFSIFKSMAHPNISRIFDFGRDAETGLYFFTSELFSDGDLTNEVGGNLRTIEALLLQALRALEYLTNHRLLHFDIKPQNLMLRRAGKDTSLALIDFGLATFRPPDRPGGTANYMPPELICRRLGIREGEFPYPDNRSDLYSLGVTFYYCLTGVQPFCAKQPSGSGMNLEGTLTNHLELSPPPPSKHRAEIPAYLDRIIMKLMARHPEERYQSAIIAAQALEYSSPNRYPPESIETLLSYLPKEGRLIGRDAEREIFERFLATPSGDMKDSKTAICIAGARGTGKSRLLRSMKPLAQRLDLTTELVEGHDPESHVEAISRIGGGILLIDDIDQYLEKGAELFHAFARRLRYEHIAHSDSGGRVLLAFTTNTDRMTADEAIRSIGLSDRSCIKIALGNFTRKEVGEYITVVLGERPEDAVVDQLMRCTSGNPQILTEHLEGMISEGRLFSIAGRPDARTLKAIGVDFSQTLPPQSLRDTLALKMRSLSGGSKEVASAIACWHRPVGMDELSATSSAKDVAHAVLELTKIGVIEKDERDGRFALANPMARSILRDGMDADEIHRCHDRILSYLKGKAGVKKDDLRHHVAYGSPRPMAIDALNELAMDARRNKRPLEAIAHMKALIQITGHDDVHGLAAAYAEMGNIYEDMLQYTEAARSYEKIRKLKQPDLVLKAIELAGRMELRRRDLKGAAKAFGEGLRLSGKKKQLLVWRLLFENYLGSVDLRRGDYKAAAERFEKTDAVAKKSMSPADRKSLVNNELGEALLRQGKVKQAIKVLNQELKLLNDAGDFERAAGRHYLIADALRSGDTKSYQESKRHYLEALKIARREHMLKLEIRLRNGLGNLSYQTGKYSDSIKHYRDAFRLSQQVDSLATSIELMIGMALAAQKLGKQADAIEYFEAALDFATGPKGEAAASVRKFAPTIYISLTDAYMKRRDFKKALEYAEKGKAFDRKEKLSPDLRYSLYGTIAEICIERKDMAAAKKYLPTLKSIARSFPQARAHLKSIESKIS
jgi:serine/threonine-protein kinase